MNGLNDMDGAQDHDTAAEVAAGGEENVPRLAVDFQDVLRHLRGLALPCFPPVGVGSFDVLYASEREVVVWYSPAREEHRAGEVSIPCARLATAWAALTSGEPMDEAALERCGESVAGGRWLLALLAQLPGVRVQPDPLALGWSPQIVELATVGTAATEPAQKKPRRGASGGAKPRRPRTKSTPPAARVTARAREA